MGEIEVGAQARLEFVVTSDDTAIALGSGDVPVLATPRALAWAEAATCAAVSQFLEPTETTVGSLVKVAHRAPSPVGAAVVATALVVAVERRRIDFEITLTNTDGVVAMSGEISRVRVERNRFSQ